MSEEWRDVPAWFGKYQVSDSGRVRSRASKAGGLGGVWHEMTPATQRNGYKLATFWDRGRRERWLVHALVLTAFVGPRPRGHDCCHSNGIKSDNRLENLRWATRRENHMDKRRHGTFQEGAKHGMSKLTDEAVREIRESTESHAALARRYDVSDTTIAYVRKGRTWRHVRSLESSRRAANV